MRSLDPGGGSNKLTHEDGVCCLYDVLKSMQQSKHCVLAARWQKEYTRLNLSRWKLQFFPEDITELGGDRDVVALAMQGVDHAVQCVARAAQGICEAEHGMVQASQNMEQDMIQEAQQDYEGTNPSYQEIKHD